MYNPVDIIEKYVNQRNSRTDEEILSELTALPVLPDEDDPLWEDDATWVNHALLYVAISDIAATRGLRPAVKLLLERACYGDPGEMMRDLRHSLEGIVDGDWDYLFDVCIEMVGNTNPGARLWAIDELRRLRDKRAVPVLKQALSDTAILVREEAASALEVLENT